MAHTPGPWTAKVAISPKVFADDMHVCDIRGWGHLTGVGGLRLPEAEAIAVQEANAYLIAAAPDLLDALRVARKTLEIACGTKAPYVRQAFLVIDAAISKADGS